MPVGKKPITLRHKKLADPKLSKNALNKNRKKVTRYLMQDPPYSLGVPENFGRAIKWMQKQLAAIPKAAQKTASFRFDTTTEYGETYPEITISYEEAETDEEVLQRLKTDSERNRIEKVKERAKLKELQAKYSA